MLSRVAERIYWMARYLERAENTARLINVNSNLLLDLPKGVTPGWMPLIEIMGDKEVFHELYNDANERNIIRFLASEPKNSSSISMSLYLARENARTLRDIIPSECWEAINDLHDFVKQHLPNGLSRKNRFTFFQDIIGQIQKVTGILEGTMLRDSGYHFLRIGTYLERADMTSRILDVRSGNLLANDAGDLPPFEHIQWISVLSSLSAYHSFRQEIRGIIRSASVLHFLLRSELFPRSFAHCVNEVRNCLRDLPHSKKLQEIAGHLCESLESVELTEVKDQSLYLLIDQLQIELAQLHNAIAKDYFSIERKNVAAH